MMETVDSPRVSTSAQSSSKNVFSDVQMEPPVFQFVSTVTVHS